MQPRGWNSLLPSTGKRLQTEIHKTHVCPFSSYTQLLSLAIPSISILNWPWDKFFLFHFFHPFLAPPPLKRLTTVLIATHTASGCCKQFLIAFSYIASKSNHGLVTQSSIDQESLSWQVESCYPISKVEGIMHGEIFPGFPVKRSSWVPTVKLAERMPKYMYWSNKRHFLHQVRTATIFGLFWDILLSGPSSSHHVGIRRLPAYQAICSLPSSPS